LIFIPIAYINSYNDNSYNDNSDHNKTLSFWVRILGSCASALYHPWPDSYTKHQIHTKAHIHTHGRPEHSPDDSESEIGAET
jgi:hypothetical protein